MRKPCRNGEENVERCRRREGEKGKGMRKPCWSVEFFYLFIFRLWDSVVDRVLGQCWLEVELSMLDDEESVVWSEASRPSAEGKRLLRCGSENGGSWTTTINTKIGEVSWVRP